MQMNDFTPGDLIEITTRLRNGDEVRSAVVTMVNYNGLGHINFGPRYVEGMLPTGQGTFFAEKIGTTPFGIVSVKIVGHKPIRPARFWQPTPGNRGYDLMC
jgi:hypothetical protein